MRIVLDTNVIVSGLLSVYGAPAEIVKMAASGLLVLCYDARIISEYRAVLLRPVFKFDETHIDYFLEYIETAGSAVSTVPLDNGLPDPDDEPFLEVAIGGRAKYLVTGNLKHYPLNRRKNIPVVSPVEFMEICRKIK